MNIDNFAKRSDAGGLKFCFVSRILSGSCILIQKGAINVEAVL